MTDTALALSRPSFYATVPDAPREDLLRAYRAFLEARNGALDVGAGFAKRDAWLAEASRWNAPHPTALDAATFERHYKRFDPRAELPLPVVALLTFVKINASEAYGVETVAKRRAPRDATPDVFHEVERVLAFEETYHTKILLGATQHFGVEAHAAFTPPIALRVLISTMIYAPKAVFHPVVLGAELSGLFAFTWMLRRVGEVFRDTPAVRDALEQRLIEILIDEVGHVAFNRLAVGPLGLIAAKSLAGATTRALAGSLREFRALGLGRAELREVDGFDYDDLPDEVRRRAFFA